MLGLPNRTVNNSTPFTGCFKGGVYMDKVFTVASSFLSQVLDLGIKLVAVAVILQILFGAAVPFLGIDVVAGIIKLVGALGSQGLVGLVAIAVLLWAFNRK